MPTMKLTAEWDQPEPNEAELLQALMELGFYDVDVDMDNDENPHGWGQ